LANAQIQISVKAEGLNYNAPRSGYFPRGPNERLTEFDGFFAMADELPAVLGNIHINVLLESRGWHEAATVLGVEVLPDQVVNLGDIVVSLE
jgi:hypothetical protein